MSYMKLLCHTFIGVLIFPIWSSDYSKESVTGSHFLYRELCQKASTDSYTLNNFRSLPGYMGVLEILSGDSFAEYISCSKNLMDQLENFRRLDFIGNPVKSNYPKLGSFSATTLRYIVLADQVTKLFKLPPNAKIVEIGAGFGGQCYILSQLQSFEKYYIYDLPEVEALISKMMKVLDMENVQCLPIESDLPESNIDLLISNYAFSECDRAMQIEYFERIIKKADRGYIIYNKIPATEGFAPLTADEFATLLKKAGIKPKIYLEFLSTAHDNLLIIWDKTAIKQQK